MSFNGSFGDGEFIDEEDNSNIISLKQEDFKIDFDERTKSKLSNIKSIINTSNDVTINSYTNNNLFNSLFPNEMKINIQYQNSDNYYYSLLSKELLKYNLSNIFNILKSKIIIINSQTFYLLKRISSIKTNNLINAEILYLQISGGLERFSNIFKEKRKNILFQVLYSLKTKLCLKNKFINNIGNDNFIQRYEEKYNNNNIKQLKNDIKNIENKIENLASKESKLIIEINDILKKEKKLNHKINNIEYSNNKFTKYIHINNISSNSKITKYDSDIHSLENTIETNKQLKEGKEEIIKAFMEQVNDLINDYQGYIDNIYKIDNGIKNNNINNNKQKNEININTNFQIIYHKD